MCTYVYVYVCVCMCVEFIYLVLYQVRVIVGDSGLFFFFFFFFFSGHVLFHFLCNLQQYCDSAYNKLNSLQQKEFIDLTKMNYI